MRARIKVETEYETVARWRLDRIYDQLATLIAQRLEQVPQPWRDQVRDLSHAETPEAIRRLRIKIAHDVLASVDPDDDTNDPATLADRVFCPLCGAGTQMGDGFKVPIGLERHLDAFGGKGCEILTLANDLAAMYYNEAHGRRFYDSHAM